MSYYSNSQRNEDESDEQGEIRSSSSEEEDGQLEENQANGGQGVDNEIYESGSSDDDKDRLEEEKKKREEFYKAIHQQKPDLVENPINTFENALEAASRTNKKMLIMRKKNEKRIEELQNIRMVQQPYLMAGNTHYRSSINDYPLLTIDDTGKRYLHPNQSLRVAECRLDQFIQKNIAEEGTSNYLNEVVKFENFAYQHRKKRRHNFE